MAEEDKTFAVAEVEDEFESCWCVEFGHFLPAEIPIFFIGIWVEERVFPAEIIPATIVHPDIEALISQDKGNRVLSVATNSRRRVNQPMLIQNNWLLITSIIQRGFRTPSTRNTLNRVDIAVFRFIVVLFKWVAMVDHNITQLLIYVFFPYHVFSKAECLLSYRISQSRLK